MRTGTGILTKSDVMTLTGNNSIWTTDTTRCVTVASMASALNANGISFSFVNDNDSTRGNYSSNSYRLLPYDKISFTSTPASPSTYPFNIFGDASTNSAISYFSFNGTLTLYQYTSGSTNKTFNISDNIYQTRIYLNLFYNNTTISESTFNNLYFFITGGWAPTINCKCTVFKTKGTAFHDANNNKNTSNLIYHSSTGATSVSTQNYPCRLSSIGTYDEFKRGLLGIIIYLERVETTGNALTISPTSWSANAAASSKIFTANYLIGTLSVFSKPTWATVSISGSTVTVSITANTTTFPRTGTVTFSGTGTDGSTYRPSITINQLGKTSTVQPRMRLIDTDWTEDTTASISGYTVYKSNTISDKSWTILTLEVEGYANLSPLNIYIRSYAERNYDYAVAYELDYVIEPSTYNDVADTDSRAVANTRTNQQSGTGLSSYTKVSYAIPDNNRHRICVVYRKDINGKSGDDAAYVAIPNEYLA